MDEMVNSNRDKSDRLTLNNYNNQRSNRRYKLLQG